MTEINISYSKHGGYIAKRRALYVEDGSYIRTVKTTQQKFKL